MKIIVHSLQIIAKIALTILMGFLISFLFQALLPDSFKYLSQIGMLIGVWIAYRLFERKRLWPVGFGGEGSWKQLVLGIGIGACTIFLSCAFIWLLGGVQLTSVQIDVYLLAAILSTIPKWIVVAIVEEGLMRGYIQGLVKESFGVKASILLSSLLFAFIHLFNTGSTESLLPMLFLFLDGLFFGLIKEMTGKLWFPIGAHFIWNFLQSALGFAVSGGESGAPSLVKVQPIGDAMLSGGAFGAEGSYLTACILLITLFITWKIYRKQNVKAISSL
ncbi:CPBP family intramembrane glutamic endopeptidase [Brevibacillus laterosporus]|uniref:CPBP family intramembrane glutamic endopeptidase n=1 Tax=Brevibacillus laterosporus TaxID=1465 RepID=UPI00264D4F5F|nr:type II CAAX endopeptidase family protein [Brevibacillus laterosporus]MDN9012703.1 type II CAAX endopeptidase family protein [Brevibacillus laterosporus]MDO0943792.1 type II CAAX endopeptidase family protein [Brevibacillus laterosporus]